MTLEVENSNETGTSGAGFHNLPSGISLDMSPFQENSLSNKIIIKKKLEDRRKLIKELPRKSCAEIHDICVDLAMENVNLQHNLQVASSIIAKHVELLSDLKKWKDEEFAIHQAKIDDLEVKLATLETKHVNDDKISNLVKSAVEAQKDVIVNSINSTPPSSWSDIVRFPTLEEAAGMTPEQIADHKKEALKRPGTISVPLALRAQVGAILEDQEAAEGRKLNLVVHNLQESGITDEECAKHDIAEVGKIFEICEVPLQSTDIVSLERRGPKPKADEPRRRMLVIKLKSEIKKRHLLSRLQKFRDFQTTNRPAGDIGNQPDQIPMVRVDHDMTKAQREFRKGMIQAAKKKSDNDPFFRYRIRGPPWKLEEFRVPKDKTVR